MSSRQYGEKPITRKLGTRTQAGKNKRAEKADPKRDRVRLRHQFVLFCRRKMKELEINSRHMH